MPQNFLHSLVGSMSQGAAGNPTVAMIEAAFRHHGLHWRYVNMEVPPAGLADAVRVARAMGFRGFNLSMPHKVAVIPLLDGLGESAALIGAVNCVVRRGDRLLGENTDGKGFLKSLQEVYDPRGKIFSPRSRIDGSAPRIRFTRAESVGVTTTVAVFRPCRPEDGKQLSLKAGPRFRNASDMEPLWQAMRDTTWKRTKQRPISGALCGSSPPSSGSRCYSGNRLQRISFEPVVHEAECLAPGSRLAFPD